jgi:hypothetical protein
MTVGTTREVDTETVRKNGVLARERIMSCTEKVKETRCDQSQYGFFLPPPDILMLATLCSHDLVLLNFLAAAQTWDYQAQPVFSHVQLPSNIDSKENAELVRSKIKAHHRVQ